MFLKLTLWGYGLQSPLKEILTASLTSYIQDRSEEKVQWARRLVLKKGWALGVGISGQIEQITMA